MFERIKNTLKHFGQAIAHPKYLGSLFPSSIYVIRRILKALPQPAQKVIEYGPGTGNITRQLLAKLPQGSQLIGIEVNENFREPLAAIQDGRLRIEFGGVLDVLPKIRASFPQGVDAIISGIPFSLMPAEEREKIFEQTRKAIRPGGRFIVYQSSRLLLPLFKKNFSTVTYTYEVRNIFPYFVIVGTA